jgi:RNA polymerase sigma-70 factor (TIGR02960 family)
MPKASLDAAEFVELSEPLRQELRVHCYRMLGSYDEAEDLVQDALLRAWKSRERFERGTNFRAWLYKVATNGCLDFLRAHERAPAPYAEIPGMDHGTGETPHQVAWLQPAPLPEDSVEARETIELAFVAGLQHLPPTQRAVSVLRDVLGWTAAETAQMLEMSTAAVNSALQRARPALRARLSERREDWRKARGPSGEERRILDRYVAAVQSLDATEIANVLRDDVVLTMPPYPFWFHGRGAMLAFVMASLDPASPAFLGHWRSVPTTVNTMPACANYVRLPGTTIYRAQVLDVLRIEGDQVAEITSFEPHHVVRLGLPMVLPEGARAGDRELADE